MKFLPTRRALWIGLALLVGALSFWAGRATLSPAEPATAPPVNHTYVVAEGTVHRTLDYSATGSWPRRLLGRSGSSGVVTRVYLAPGRAVESGAELFDVNERPVVVARGSVPAYGDLGIGDQGRVVEQLQSFLADQGLFQGSVDGEFNSTTESAVRAWQTSVGLNADGRVRRGDLLFAPALPVRVVLDSGVAVGAEVSTGQEIAFRLADSPRFRIVLDAGQADLVPLSAGVVVSTDGHRWRGRIGQAETTPAGELVLHLEGPGGKPLCGRQCHLVSPSRDTEFPVEIIVVPRTSGPIIPAAAMQTDDAGDVFVTSTNGEQLPVRVVASDGGWSVVEGVMVGTKIELFGRVE